VTIKQEPEFEKSKVKIPRHKRVQRGIVKKRYLYPGKTEKERHVWESAWNRYLSQIDYPIGDHPMGYKYRGMHNPEYVAMRDLWIRTRVAKIKMKAQFKAHEAARKKLLEEIPSNRQVAVAKEVREIISEKMKKVNSESKIVSQGEGIPAGQGKAPTTHQQIATQSMQKLKLAAATLPKMPRSRRKVKPPPTGYHSPRSIYKWLVYYLPNHFRGDRAMRLAFGKVRRSVFKILISLQTTAKPQPGVKQKRPRLYFGQKRMIKWMMDNPWAAFEVFRSAGKTQLAIGVLVYLICENPNLRLFYLSEEQKKTIRRVRLVRSLLTSKRIVEDYGYLINDGIMGKSTESMFQCYRTIDAIEPTLMAITWRDAQALGYHYDGGILDDPWSQKLQNEVGAKKRWLEWWGEFRFCLEDAKFCWMLRTRKALHDLYEELDKKQLWAVYRQKLVLKLPSNIKFKENTRGVITDVDFDDDYMVFDECFGKYSMKNLLLLQKEDPYYFEREIQNNPYMIEGDTFKWAKIRQYNAKSADLIVRGFYDQIKSSGGGVSLIKIMDMSFGVSDQSDFNVLLVLGKYKNRYFVEDAWVGRWDFDQRLKIIEEAEEKFPGVPLYIESDFWQIAIIKDIKKKLPHLIIREFQSKGKGKDHRSLYEGEKKASKKGKIHDSLVVPWGDGRIYVRKGLAELQMLKEQSAQFPRCTYFDYLDTLAMGIIVLRPKGASVAVFS